MASSGSSESSKSPQYNAEEQGALPSNSSTSNRGNEAPSNRSGNRIDPAQFKVVTAAGDGRCLFCSLIICIDPNLQSCDRNDDGRPTNLILEIRERSKADDLRTRVITHMCENID